MGPDKVGGSCVLDGTDNLDQSPNAKAHANGKGKSSQ